MQILKNREKKQHSIKYKSNSKKKKKIVRLTLWITTKINSRWIKAKKKKAQTVLVI